MLRPEWKYFNVEEFACHDGTEVPNELLANLDRLVTGVLMPLRERWGHPLYVVSGYRTEDWNRRVAGVGKSRHLLADAADIKPSGGNVNVPRLHKIALDMYHEGKLPTLGGIGLYSGWVHFDSRPRAEGQRLAMWYGNGVGSEVA